MCICTQTIYKLQVYKTKFQVTTPAGTKYMVGNDSTPHSIAINGDVNAELKTMEGDRYMAMHMGSEQDNMTKTTVVINCKCLFSLLLCFFDILFIHFT